MMVDMLPSALLTWLDWFVDRFHLYVLSPVGFKNFGVPGIVLAVTVVLEIAARKDWRVRYGSRNCRVDFLYYVFYYGGIYHILFFAWMYRALVGLVTDHAPWLQMNLMASMPPALQIVTLILASDFIGYWSHRWRHSNRYLWAFHTIHHSQTRLTLLTNYRFHFVDETLLRLWMFIPFQILGMGIAMWLWADFIMAWVLLQQHSEWNWTYGRFGRIFVSPVFHRMHHSTDERLQNRNFSMLFSFWDDLFGTAERNEPIPTHQGIAGNPVPESWLGQIIYPFVEIARGFPGIGPTPLSSVPPAGTPAE
jgi:sterol desaturase/sphingolipid hydroxylase (fatty acid hydroxylase superfamily)